MATVLVIEDEEPVRDLLTMWLDDAEHEAVTAGNGIEGLRELYNNDVDVIVADVMMPGMDGFEFCRLAREICQAPILMLTALGSEQDKVKGLGLGADDYVVKPIGMDEFLARINALLRRYQWSREESGEDSDEDTYADSVVTIHKSRHQALVRGEQVELTPIEFKLLCMLTDNAGKTCELRDIRRQVWESDHYSSDVVRWHVASLRGKIEADAKSPELLKTVWGVGYRYDIPAPTS